MVSTVPLNAALSIEVCVSVFLEEEKHRQSTHTQTRDDCCYFVGNLSFSAFNLCYFSMRFI